MNDISECNTCAKCGIWCKYGIQSHHCSKEPCVQQGRSSDENRNATKRREFTHSDEHKCNCSICSFAASIKAYFKAHKLNQSGERKFTCNLCSFTAK